METIFQFLKDDGKLDYGCTIKKEDLLFLFGVRPLVEDDVVNMSFVEIKKRLQEDNLQELAISDYIREQLLHEGKYFYRIGQTYCVALPSQNASKADSYMKSARKKMKRASLLIANTPKQAADDDKQQKSRLLLSDLTAERQQIRNIRS